MRPQKNNCFYGHCLNRIADGDPTTWLRDIRYGWIAELDRWFCQTHVSMWNTLYRDLALAVQTFHALTLMLANVEACLKLEYVEKCKRAETRVDVLRMTEADFVR